LIRIESIQMPQNLLINFIWGAGATRSSSPRLRQVLRYARDQGRPYHVVHFDGHGTYLDATRSTSHLARWQPAECLGRGVVANGLRRCPQAGCQLGCLGAALFGGGQRGEGLPADRMHKFGAVLAG